MYKKSFVITIALCLSLIAGMVGCAGKNVRHLASDVGLITPGTTTKDEVLTYLGQPDAEYNMEGGNLLWVYYEKNSDLLRGTPYIGEKLGAEIYEVVKVAFNGDIVQTSDYRTMGAGEFSETGFAE